jgi:hypothetical protein
MSAEPVSNKVTSASGREVRPPGYLRVCQTDKLVTNYPSFGFLSGPVSSYSSYQGECAGRVNGPGIV